MENVIYNLACAHDRRRFQVRVACLDAVGPLSLKLEEQGVSSHLVRRMTPGLSMFYPRPLIRHIRESGCNIVHTHSGCWSKVTAACAWIPGLKLVYTDHGRAFPETRDRLLANRAAVRFTDRVVAVGEALRQYLLKTVRLPAQKVVTIRNGVDTQRFRPCTATRTRVRAELGYSDDDVVVAMVARLAAVKRHHLLFEAFHDIASTFDRVKLLIVGDGPLRGDLERLAGALSLTSRVYFTGDRPDVERLLNGADIATLSSASEGTSLTLLEAMATGLPVVATAVGGNSDVITHGKTGLLVSQDRAHYALALSSLAASASRRRLLGENARVIIGQHWSIHAMARQYEDLYSELTPGSSLTLPPA